MPAKLQVGTLVVLILAALGAAVEFGNLQGQIKALDKDKIQEEIEIGVKKIKKIRDAAEETLGSFLRKEITNFQQHKLVGLELKTVCSLDRKGSCKSVRPPCPTGFTDATVNWQDHWPGGKCGGGYDCRLCVKYLK